MWRLPLQGPAMMLEMPKGRCPGIGSKIDSLHEKHIDFMVKTPFRLVACEGRYAPVQSQGILSFDAGTGTSSESVVFP